MFTLILFTLQSFASAQTATRAEQLVNQNLSAVSARQEFQKNQMEIEKSLLEEENEFRKAALKAESENPYGVVYDSPFEGQPNFDKPSKEFKRNPMEQTRVDARLGRLQQIQEERAQRAYENQYIRNAERDGAQVYINKDKIVFDSGKQKSAPARYNASAK